MPTVDEVLQQGWQLHQAGRFEDAERVYRRVLTQLPKHPASLVYLGITLFDQRRFDESAAAYRAAINEQPHFPVAWNNLGNSLRMLGRVDEAEVCLAEALKQQPGYLSALKNRGTLWVWAGEVERGLQWYQEGLKVDPEHAELHRNLGVIQLLLGQYDVGWPEYRWRWRMPGLSRPNCQAPLWTGQELHGKSILLYPEQGRGDAIQFVRMAPMLTQCGATVTIECDPEMIALFSCVDGTATLIPRGIPLPAVDYQASFIEAVDYRFGQTGCMPTGNAAADDQRWTGRDDHHPGRYIHPPQSLVDYWQRWLGQQSSGLRVGINWQGNPEHHADVYRSIPLASLASLAAIQDVSLVSLQFGYGSEQLATCSFTHRVIQLPTPLDTSGGAFMDTAAIIASLDVVATTDTSIAHLAGALGKPVLLMLGKVPDWRWLIEGDTTPWYPSMTLIRQRTLGDWTDVMRTVVERVRWMAARNAAN